MNRVSKTVISHKIRAMLILISITLTGCGTNHFHDGTYQASVFLYSITVDVNGNEVNVENSLTGKTKFTCTQYTDRIEYNEDNGVRRVLYSLSDGSLKFSDNIVFKKVK